MPRDAQTPPVISGTEATRPGIGVLLANATFLRLWSIGGCVNAMRWFEVLAAALFTLDATGSDLAVAVVSAARTMPMLLLGAFAGVVTESVNRKHVLLIGQTLTAMASATVAVLGALGLAEPWHVACAALVAGTVWSTEMATRRRMVGECVPGAMVSRALALDTTSNSFTRLIGPVIAGTIYQFAGIAGAFAFSACVYALAAALVAGLPYRQEVRKLVLGNVPRDLAEGLSFARRHVIITGVLGVTIAMNLLGFPYSALAAPLGKEVFHVSPLLIGVLAAAEAFGAFLGGLRLARGDPPGSGRPLMVGGSLLFLACVALMPQSPFFWLACGLLTLGGFGSAAFANMQTSLIITHAPPQIRSRLMGLLTVCIGMGPLGILLVGFLAESFGLRHAIDMMSLTGFVAVAWVGWRWRQKEKR
jgi:MFS family permease